MKVALAICTVVKKCWPEMLDLSLNHCMVKKKITVTESKFDLKFIIIILEKENIVPSDIQGAMKILN